MEITQRDKAWDTALRYLTKHDSVTTHEIVINADVSQQTANRTLRSMERMGYVTRESEMDHTFYANDRCYLFDEMIDDMTD